MIRATRLPLHPRPLPYEALSSWVNRLAAAYELERYEFLRAMLGADPPPDAAELDGGRRPDLIATFADRTGFPPERVRAMTLAGYTPELIDTAMPSAGLFEAYVCRFGWFMPQRSQERTQFCSWKVTQRARMVVWPIGRNSRYSVRSEATIPLFDRKNHSSAPTWVLQDMTSGGGQRWPSGHRALARRAASCVPGMTGSLGVKVPC